MIIMRMKFVSNIRIFDRRYRVNDNDGIVIVLPISRTHFLPIYLQGAWIKSLKPYILNE